MLNANSRFGNINFNGGYLSSDGGAILLFEFIERFGLKKLLAMIPFFDDRNHPLYSNADIAYQMICRTLLGYFRQADQKYLGEDPLISKYYLSCSQPTASRFYGRATQASNNELKELLTKTACDFINENIENPLIDADSTLAATNGKQEAASYISHYGAIGYHPLVINEFNSKLLLSALLRSGNAYSSNGIIGELETIMAFLRPKGKIRFRGDSAFYDHKLLDYLENLSATYYIRAKGFKALTRAVTAELSVSISMEEWQTYTPTHPYYGEVEYEITHSQVKRRMVYKAYWTEENGQVRLLPEIYCVITNDREMSAKEVMDFYEQRGASENFTKELKGDFHGGMLSHRNFCENEVDFLISCVSYNLFHLFRNQILTGADRKMTMNRYRVVFQKIAVRVSIHARKICLAFSTAYNNQKKFHEYWHVVLQI